MIVSKIIFVDVVLNIFVRNRIICTTYAILAQSPEALNGVRVRLAQDENPLLMRNNAMLVAVLDKGIIGLEFVSINLRSLFDVRINNRKNGFALNIGDFMRDQFTAAFNHSKTAVLLTVY